MIETSQCDRPGGPPADRRPPTAVLAAATAAIAALVSAAVWGEAAGEPGGWRLGLDIAVGLLGCALVPVTLRRPVGGALALAVLAAVSPAATPPATMGTLVVARVRPFWVACWVALAGTAAHVLRGAWRPMPGLAFGWWLLLAVVVHAGLLGWGALGQARTALLASLAERARRAEAEQAQRVAEARRQERSRIAREMHDVLAHRLSLLATYAGAVEFRPDAPPERLAKAAGVIRTGAHQALDELREVVSLLRDEPADGPAGGSSDERSGGSPGGPRADASRPQPTLADLPRLVEESREAGVPVRLDNRVADPAAVPAGAGRTAYRVVQEGLTNARKHAAGQPVRVAVGGGAGDQLVVEISNPLPADPLAPPAAPGGGTGLIGLAERVQLAGGEVDHGVTPAGEFHLRARIPWPA